VFDQLLAKCQTLAASQPGTRKKRKFRFKNPLLSLDASVIDLCASMFDWAKFRTTKGGIKVHMLLDNQGLLPSYALITDAKTSDIRPAREMTFSPGTILVFDRGYNDFLWFVTLTLQGVWFVTRMKDGTRYRIVERREVPRNGDVLRDDVIELDVNLKPYDIELDSPVLFRRIMVRVPGRDEPMVFLTNHLQFAASTIAATIGVRRNDHRDAVSKRSGANASVVHALSQ
jgi:hypothetical protein